MLFRAPSDKRTDVHTAHVDRPDINRLPGAAVAAPLQCLLCRPQMRQPPISALYTGATGNKYTPHTATVASHPIQ